MTLDQLKIDRPEIKALTWKEPFASLMLHGKIETRSRKTNYRGWVLICAGKTPYSTNDRMELQGYAQVQRVLKLQRAEPTHTGLFTKEILGKAIAIGLLSDCRKMTEADEDATFLRFNPDLYCHVYSEVIPIEPFNFKGKQGWSKLKSDIWDKIFHPF